MRRLWDCGAVRGRRKGGGRKFEQQWWRRQQRLRWRWWQQGKERSSSGGGGGGGGGGGCGGGFAHEHETAANGGCNCRNFPLWEQTFCWRPTDKKRTQKKKMMGSI
jgi:hypothetical protein